MKLLALSPGARLHRDRVVDALWPETTLELAMPRLHKAAHYARRALDTDDAVVLRGDVVALLPGAKVEIDAVTFEAAADAALATNPVSPRACEAALDLSGGELLPEDLAEWWLEEPRARLKLRVEQLLRGAHRWEELLRLDPANEEAHLELLRTAVAGGNRTLALRRYADMERVLGAELGISPGSEAVALRERLLVGESGASRSRRVQVLEPPQETSRRTLEEREVECEILRAAVRSVGDQGRGVVVLLSGEAGAGKTALVRSFLGSLDDQVTAMLGGCDDLLAPRSLGPFRDMAEEHPRLGEALSGGRPDEAFPALLRSLSAKPCVVVVEDVHWADDATLDAVRYLSRRISSIPAVLLLTFREAGVDADHPLRQILGGLAGPTVRRLGLTPLSVEAVRRLGAATDAQAAEIHRVTQGNPFFVTEVLAAEGTGVPATVRDAVLARVGMLPPAVRLLLERLSVVPTRVERWLAERLADDDPGLLLQAERSGMLTGSPASVSFRHELARQAMESALTVGERMQANGQVVDALLGRPPVESSRLVHHAQRAARVDVLLEHGPLAAREAARLGAHRQATEVLRVVLEHRARVTPGEVADLLTRRAYSLYVVSHFEEALEDAESSVAAAEEADDHTVLADALLVLSRVVMFARGPKRARHAAERAVKLLEPLSDDARLAEALTELARAHSNLPTVGIVAEPSEVAATFAQRALDIGRQLHRDDIAAQASCYL